MNVKSSTTLSRLLKRVLSVTTLASIFWPRKQKTVKLEESLIISPPPSEDDIKQAIKTGRVAEATEKQAGLVQK